MLAITNSRVTLIVLNLYKVQINWSNKYTSLSPLEPHPVDIGGSSHRESAVIHLLS